jgi:hypothetical protein
MKPAIWRIFRNGRWSYSDSPSTRSEERAAWQPLYAEQPTVQAEREACAKVCEQPVDEIQITDDCSEYKYRDNQECADAIRARGEQ